MAFDSSVCRVSKFSFDYDQLRESLDRKMCQEHLTVKAAAAEIGVEWHTLGYYLRNSVSERKRHMTVDNAVKIMVWLGDYDIRDYLVEERVEVEAKVEWWH